MKMSELSEKLNAWADGGAAALVLEQPLRPVVGTLVFPPTFAPARRGDPSDYIVDEIDGHGVVTLDTPGSEANRLEPLFMRPPLAELMPQITVTAGNQQKNLLELGHRVADALIRSVQSKAKLVEEAFEQALIGDHSALASFAPTSLVFGAWDSRGTGAKLPRLLEARVDAYGVERRHRAAQYFAAVDYVEVELLDQSTVKKELDQRSQAGFRDSPSGRQPGGVELVEGGRIVRTLTVHLAGVQALGAGADPERGRNLRRYVLGLALAAATARLPLFLRQGCNLVPPMDGPPARWVAVDFNGSQEAVDLPHENIVSYARAARDAMFPKGLHDETWTATKAGAQKEVKKRAKGDDESGATTSTAAVS
jgi:CRISPR-associated protein Csb1